MTESEWPLARIYADLATLKDVARELDVTTWRVQKWVERRERVKCPYPVRANLGGTDVYSMEEWKGWFWRWIHTRGYEAKDRPVKTFRKQDEDGSEQDDPPGGGAGPPGGVP